MGSIGKQMREEGGKGRGSDPRTLAYNRRSGPRTGTRLYTGRCVAPRTRTRSGGLAKPVVLPCLAGKAVAICPSFAILVVTLEMFVPRTVPTPTGGTSSPFRSIPNGLDA